jgi:hypothetical protein
MSGLLDRLASRASGRAPGREVPARPQVAPLFATTLTERGDRGDAGSNPLVPAPRPSAPPSPPVTKSSAQVTPAADTRRRPTDTHAPMPPSLPPETGLTPAPDVPSTHAALRAPATLAPDPLPTSPPRTPVVPTAEPLRARPQVPQPAAADPGSRAVELVERLVERTVMVASGAPGTPTTTTIAPRRASAEPVPVARPVRPPAAITASPLTPAASAAAVDREPAIEIRIGRVDVRTSLAPGPPVPASTPTGGGEAAGAPLSLASYLKGERA